MDWLFFDPSDGVQLYVSAVSTRLQLDPWVFRIPAVTNGGGIVLVHRVLYTANGFTIFLLPERLSLKLEIFRLRKMNGVKSLRNSVRIVGFDLDTLDIDGGIRFSVPLRQPHGDRLSAERTHTRENAPHIAAYLLAVGKIVLCAFAALDDAQTLRLSDGCHIDGLNVCHVHSVLQCNPASAVRQAPVLSCISTPYTQKYTTPYRSLLDVFCPVFPCAIPYRCPIRVVYRTFDSMCLSASEALFRHVRRYSVGVCPICARNCRFMERREPNPHSTAMASMVIFSFSNR